MALQALQILRPAPQRAKAERPANRIRTTKHEALYVTKHEAMYVT